MADARKVPERAGARLRLAACLVVSGVAHCAAFPLDVPHSFEVQDVEGEAAIPIDVLAADEAPPPPAVPDPVPETKTVEVDKSATLPQVRDAGGAHDAGAADAEPDAPPDAPPDGAADGAPDAAADGDG